MPDGTIETPTATFASFREHRAETPLGKVEIEERDTSSKSSAAKSEDEAHVDGSDPSKGQGKNVEKRLTEIQQNINKQLERARLAKEEADREEARVAKLKDPSSKAAPQETKPAPAAAAYDGADDKDPRPERPKKPSRDTDASGKPWASWADYETAQSKYDDDMEEFRDNNAAWVSRAEWRKADRAKQETAAQEAQRAAVNKDLEDFESTAKKWAKENSAEDFDGLFDEIKKRPVLSTETASVTMYGGEEGAGLLYHLMTDPDKLEAIEKMARPIDRLNELYRLKYELAYGKLETKRAERKPAQEKPRSAAPAAGTRLPQGQGSGGGSSKEPKSFADYRAKKYG